MGKRRKKKAERRRARLIDARVVDPRLLELTNLIDAGRDIRWLRDHPGEKFRRRPATRLEQAVFGVPPGTIVTIIGPLPAPEEDAGLPPGTVTLRNLRPGGGSLYRGSLPAQ